MLKNIGAKKKSLCVDIIKIVLLFTFISFIIFGIIVCLDYNNIPSELINNEKINLQNWLNNIIGYISGILGTIIAATISVKITMFQIERNNELNKEINAENFRIQNRPILNYWFTSINEEMYYDYSKNIETIFKEHSFELIMSMKNIGLNIARITSVKALSNILKNEETELLDDGKIIIAEKGKDLYLDLFMNLEIGKNYNIKFKVYYEDILQNKYLQIVNVYYHAFAER